MEDEDYITLEDGETILLSDVTDEGDEMENKEEDEDDVEAEPKRRGIPLSLKKPRLPRRRNATATCKLGYNFVPSICFKIL